MNKQLEEEIKKWKDGQTGACACLGKCERCGYHICFGCICSFAQTLQDSFHREMVEKIENLEHVKHFQDPYFEKFTPMGAYLDAMKNVKDLLTNLSPNKKQLKAKEE